MSNFTKFQIYDLLNRPRPLWLVKVDLSETNLWMADLSECNLSWADISRSDLSWVNLI
ncbi:MAG: pentapeptide repeat-containing protein, partial [Anaerolineales bacterium]|nr:pentapeptide repeat-containing protein [Anaerolineales bacterium]